MLFLRRIFRGRRRIFRDRDMRRWGDFRLMRGRGLVGIFRRRTGRRPGVGASGNQQRAGNNRECARDGDETFIHGSLHLVLDNSNGTGLGFCYSAFPVDGSAASCCPKKHDDPNSWDPQEILADALKISR
jgi:hypothetical protein